MFGMNIDHAFFLIESGPMLEAITEYRAARQAQDEHQRAMLAPLGVTHVRRRYDSCAITAVTFEHGQAIPEGWTKPDRQNGSSRPKKGTLWADQFAKQPRVRSESDLILSVWPVPSAVKFAEGSGWGSYCIGHPFRPCGFLWSHHINAMYCPDVPAAVALMEAQYPSRTVDAEVKAFRLEFEGLRRITKTEWAVMTAESKEGQG